METEEIKKQEQKEQKLKDEYDKTILRAVEILKEVERMADARWLENIGMDKIGCDWITELEKDKWVAEIAEKVAKEEKEDEGQN